MARGISSADELLSVIDYDAESGLFTRVAGRTAGRTTGSVNGQGYLNITINGKTYLAHRLAWLAMTGNWPEFEIDHINGIKSDNRADNLRQATRHQNAQNVSRKNGSRLKGTCKIKTGWVASIKANGAGIYLGIYKTAEEAHAAYCKAASELHGSFARQA